jgi:hypothetical protein
MKSRGRWLSAPVVRSSKFSKLEKANTGLETHKSFGLFGS